MRPLRQSPVDVLPVPAERVGEVRRRRERSREPLARHVHLELHPQQLRLKRGPGQRDVELAIGRIPLRAVARVVEGEGTAHDAHRLKRGLGLQLTPQRVAFARAAPGLHLPLGFRNNRETVVRIITRS